MKNFEPRETEFIGEIKSQVEKFIRKSNVIDEETKAAFREELGSNWYDDRFDGTKFIDAAVRHSIHDWREQNLKLAELWKNIAINNAKVNNEPHLVADEAVARFRDEFDAFEY